MIVNKKAVTMAEVAEIVKNMEGREELKEFLKKFNKLTQDKALKMAEDISALNNPKIKSDDIVKIVDFMPGSSEELNKIITESSMSEEETNAVLEIVKKY